MPRTSKQAKLESAAGVICKQGMVQFSVSDTAIAIVAAIVGDNEDELDLIVAFREMPSQTMDQLVESSGFPKERVEQLANSLAKKGLIFNQKEGLLDLAFDQYRKLPLEEETKGLFYNLGLAYEEKGLIKRALSAYEYINRGGAYKDLERRIVLDNNLSTRRRRSRINRRRRVSCIICQSRLNLG